ncbi:MAG: hypothetical protein KKH88_00375 [Nanoarchaeota archaeon]|nr:hypothetical protein [Nanoarchaeota archaeon]
MGKKLCLGILVILLFSSFVFADDYQYGVGVEALGFQSGQPYYGAGSGASVNAYSGNLVLSATDASIAGANGLGAGFTRIYNSNVHATRPFDSGEPDAENLLKPGPLGHGWSGWHMGKIDVPFWKPGINEPASYHLYPGADGSCGVPGYGACLYTDGKFYLEGADGSKQIMLSNNGKDFDGSYTGDDLYVQTLYRMNMNDPGGKKYIFTLPDLSKVYWYHAIDAPVGYCLENAGDAFVRVDTAGNTYYYTHWVRYDSAWSDYMEGSYCDSTSDCNGGDGYYCDTINKECLLDSVNKVYRQFMYPGVYLSRIKDPNGNEIIVDYYHHRIYGYDGEDGCHINDAPTLVKARTYGSPFIRSIKTKNAHGVTTGEIEFEFTDSETIDGKLNYITYKNFDGRTHKIDYTYSEDLPDNTIDNPYYGQCYPFNGITCDDNDLLIEVGLYDLGDDNDIYETDFYPLDDYEHEHGMICPDTGCYGLCGYLCTDEAADNYCRNVKGYDYAVSKHCYGDDPTTGYNFGCTASNEEDPFSSCELAPDEEKVGWIDHITCYKDPPGGDGLLFPPVQYEYYPNPVTGPEDLESFFALKKITSPFGVETEYKYDWAGANTCDNSEGHKKMYVDSYTVKENPLDSSALVLRYDYDYDYLGPNGYCSYDPNLPLSKSRTTMTGPFDESGTTHLDEKYSEQVTEYFDGGDILRDHNSGEASWNSFSGKIVSSEVYACTTTGGCESDPRKKELTGYTHKEGTHDSNKVSVGVIINDPSWGPHMSEPCAYGDSLQCLDSLCYYQYCLNEDGVFSGYYPDGENLFDFVYYNTAPSGKIVEINENGQQKTYAQKMEYGFYYGLEKSINFGEINSFNVDDSRLIEFTINDDDNPDDAVMTESEYMHINNGWDYFLRLPTQTVVRDCDVVGGDCSDGGEILAQTTFDEYDNKAQLLSTSVWDNTPGNERWLTTNLQYNGKGDVIKVTTNLDTVDEKEYSMAYTSTSLLKSEWVWIDGERLKKEYVYTCENGNCKLTSQIDENENVYTYEYDTLGRLIEVYLPGDGSNPSSRIVYHDPTSNDPNEEVWAKVFVKDDGGIELNPITNYYDNLGRNYQTKQMDPENTDMNIVIETLYNAEGLVNKTSKPFHEENGGAMGRIRDRIKNLFGVVEFREIPTQRTGVSYTEYKVYDELKRLREVQAAGATETVTTEYGPDWSRVFDENNKYVTSYTDAYGRTIRVEQIIDDVLEDTNFEYDKLGNLKKTIDANNHESTSVYNSLGQVQSSSHPDAGDVTLTYDLNGNIKTSNDGLNVVTYHYDDINRLIKIAVDSGSGSELVKEYFYDYCSNGKGKLCAVTSNSEDGISGYTTMSYEYDENGNVIEFVQSVDGKLYKTYYEYYDGGSLKKITYPDNKIVEYTYDDIGRLKTVSVDGQLIEDIQAYNVEGTIASLIYGNSVVTQYGYTTRDWLQSIDVNKDTENIFEVSYKYDNVGNLEEEFNSLTQSDINKIATYNYDDIYRLTGVTDPGTGSGKYGFDLGYVYDKVGNRLSKTVGGKTTAYNTGGDNIDFNINNQLTSAGLFDYGYSDTGNMITKQGKIGIEVEFLSSNQHQGDNYALLEVDADVGDPVRVSYSGVGCPAVDCFVWYSVVEQDNSGKIILINSNNYNSEESYSQFPPGLLFYNGDHEVDEFTVKPSNVDYVYNYANMLTKVDYSNGDCEGYVYNPNGMRVKKVSTKIGLATYYIYDVGGNVILEETETYSGDSCEPEIYSAVCGNMIIESPEPCDYYIYRAGGFTSQCSDFPYSNDGISCPGNFVSGTVSCSGCTTIDYSACNDPTDYNLESGEECIPFESIFCGEVSEYCIPDESNIYTTCNSCSVWNEPGGDQGTGGCDCSQAASCHAKGGVCINNKDDVFRQSCDPGEQNCCECVEGTCMNWPFGGTCNLGNVYECNRVTQTFGGGTIEPGFYEVVGGCSSATACCLAPWEDDPDPTKGLRTAYPV